MTIKDQMQAIEISAPGGPEVLKPIVTATPVRRPGEVLIAVAAAGVNGPDISQRQGAYPPPADSSPLPGLEVSGVVAAMGEGETRFAVGDAVVALCNGGGYAAYVAVPAGQVLPKPANWSHVEAATLPETFFHPAANPHRTGRTCRRPDGARPWRIGRHRRQRHPALPPFWRDARRNGLQRPKSRVCPKHGRCPHY